MRIVRVLLYEGPEQEIKDHLSSTNMLLKEGTVKEFLGCTIREVFRGQLSEPGKVFFIDPSIHETHVSAEQMDADKVKIGGTE